MCTLVRRIWLNPNVGPASWKLTIHIQSVVATGGVYKEQGLNRHALMTQYLLGIPCWQEPELQSSIPTASTSFIRLPHNLKWRSPYSITCRLAKLSGFKHLQISHQRSSGLNPMGLRHWYDKELQSHRSLNKLAHPRMADMLFIPC